MKPQKSGLILELMYFPSELIDASEFKAPTVKSVSKSEMRMALQLVESMTTRWEPEKYSDEYREALKELIEEKVEHGEKATPAPPKRKKPSNVVDLVSILQKSIEETGNEKKAIKPKAKTRPKSRTAPKRKKAA